MSMLKVLLAITFVSLFTSVPVDRCSCQKALENDRPHGANEDIEYLRKTLTRIRGRVVYYNNDKPADDIVVEVYKVANEDKSLRPHKIALRGGRFAACVTGSDGAFSFPDLPSGSYVLRAGTRSGNAGMNEVYMKVIVDRHWWSSWLRSSKAIELGLTPGT